MLEPSQSAAAIETIHNRLFAILAPPPRYNVREFADDLRYLSKESCAQSGKYRSSFAPFQREPQEGVTDISTESTCLMWATQLGKTTILENIHGFFIRIDPSPQLMVQPTVELAESFSKERFDPMCRDTPSLVGLVKDARSRDSGNTISRKVYPGGNIVFVGSNAPSGLAGRPRRVVVQDEIDRYPASAGEEGDPCKLADRRAEGFWNAVFFKTSTPTVKGISRIEKFYEQSDKRMWFVPCPKCGAHQVLKWRQVQWPEDKPEDAFYKCENESCGAEWSDADRLRAVKAGEWRATAPVKGKRGYWLNGINTVFKPHRGFKNRLHEMVSEFLEAKKGGVQTMRVWTNTFLAETFEEEVDRIEHGPLLKRAENYSPDKLPVDVVIVLASADVQKDRIEIETVGLGMDDETWGVECIAIRGDTEQDEVWQDLALHLRKTYTREDGVILPITASTYDMRHNPSQVRKFVQTAGIPRAWAVYGVGGDNPMLVTTRFSKRHRLRTFAVNGKIAKDTIFARIKVQEHGPRFMHFPRGNGYNEEYFQQLVAEVLKTTYLRGFPKQLYVKTRERNEALDLRVYHLAAVDILKPNLTAIARKLKPQVEPEPGKIYELKSDAPAEPPKPVASQRKIVRYGNFGGFKI